MLLLAHLLLAGVSTLAVTVNLDVPVGPVVARWGWDIKGNANRFSGQRDAANAYADANANLLRIPIFAPLHSANGDIDVSGSYGNMLNSINQVLAVNPNVEIFASLKLSGAATFPGWVSQPSAAWPTENGSVFGDAVQKPNPEHYSGLIASYIDWLRSEGIKIDYLGLNNETLGALTWDRYIDTVDLLPSRLDALGVPAEYRDFELVGPDAFGIPTSETFVQNLMNVGRLDTIDIAGSHFYPQYASGQETDWEDLAALSGKPLWHTEVHMPVGNAEYVGIPEQAVRDTLSVLFASNKRGVESFVWWGYNNNENSLGSLVRGNVINSTLGAYPIETTPTFTAKDDAPQQPLYQAYLNGDRVALWVANPGDALTDLEVEIDFDGIVAVPGTRSQSFSVTFWGATDTGDAAPSQIASAAIAIAADSMVIDLVPENSVGVVYFDVWRVGDANLDGLLDQNDIKNFVDGWLSEQSGPTLDSWMKGDFDRDGITSMADFVILRQAFRDQGLSLPSLSELATEVAEPGALPLVVSATLIQLLLGRRSRLTRR